MSVADTTCWEAETIEAIRGIDERTPSIQAARWFGTGWVESTVRATPREFRDSFGRWRELYRSASWMRDDARKLMDAPRATRQEREDSERR